MTDIKPGKPGKGENKPNAQEPKNNPTEGGEGGDPKPIPKQRFDEVNTKFKAAQKELDEIKAKASKEAEDKLKKDKKWETLATKREAEVAELKADLGKSKIRSAVEREAAKAGATDPADVYGLLDKSQIEVDKDGNIGGVEEAVKVLLEAKPYLKGEGKPVSDIGSGSNPKSSQEKTYPISWVREKWADMGFVNSKQKEHGNLTGEKFLNKIESEGRIDYTS